MFEKILKKKPIVKLKITAFPIEKDVKYLGVFLDQKLNFNKHVHTSVEKARTRYN
jgi:hypothetical protein